MKINLNDIPEGGIFLEGDVPADRYDLPLKEFQKWETIHYRFQTSILGTECLVDGELETTFAAPCSRCLEPLPLTIHIKDFSHSYATEEVESIDLTQDIREDILLALPFAPRCELDANSRCPLTGKSYQEKPSEFEKLKRESAWKDLDHFKK